MNQTSPFESTAIAFGADAAKPVKYSVTNLLGWGVTLIVVSIFVGWIRRTTMTALTITIKIKDAATKSLPLFVRDRHANGVRSFV